MSATVYIPIIDNQSRRKENADVALAVLGGIICFGMSLSLSRLWVRSGGFLLTAFAASVNGSVWESAKAVCIPLLLWAGAESFVLRVNYRRMTAAAALSLLSAGIFHICASFVCFGVLGFAPVWLCRVLTALSVALGQWVSVRVKRFPGRVEEYWFWYAAALALLLYALLSFTVNPPHIGLFFDPAQNIYGMG